MEATTGATADLAPAALARHLLASLTWAFGTGFADPFENGAGLSKKGFAGLGQFDAARLEISLGKIGEVEIKSPETALLREMMNRRESSRALKITGRS